MTKHKNSHDNGIDRYHDLDPNQDRIDQLKSVYANWADTYDTDNDAKLGTVSQPSAVALLAGHLPDKSASILDVGCGTGLVGKHLKHAGYTTFDGTDLTNEMLEIARPRGYRALFQADADAGLPVSDDGYDAVMCVGVFTHGHLGPEGIWELIRVANPGGLLVFTVNEGVWKSEGFDAAIDQLNRSGTLEILEAIKQDYMVQEGVRAWYIAARKPHHSDIRLNDAF